MRKNRAVAIFLFFPFFLSSLAAADAYKYYVQSGNDPDRPRYDTALEICENYRTYIQTSQDEVNPGGMAYISYTPSEDIDPTLKDAESCEVTWERTVNGITGSSSYHIAIYAGGCYDGRRPIEGVQWPSEPNNCEGDIYDVNCRSPYVFNPSKPPSDQCEAFCSEGQAWDATLSVCVAPPEQQSCETQSDHPIDFLQGRKYRDEPVIEAGKRLPIALRYRYNNHHNQERTPSGSQVAVHQRAKYLAATTAPISASEYKNFYTNIGVRKDSPIYNEQQAYGSVSQYWRHSFDEVLLIQSGEFRFHTARGQVIYFNGLGASAAYPHLELQPLAAGEAAFSGYKLLNRKNNVTKQFDANGRLLKILRGPNDVLTISYDAEGRIDRVTNSEGAFIQLGYTTLPTDSIYSVEPSTHHYPISFTNDRGETANIKWGKAHQGQTAKFHLITQITEATSGEPTSARVFKYNDARFGASLTDMVFVADINVGVKEPLLHFEYDDQGRAVYSGTVDKGGSDSVQYLDDYTRIVTNALGKKATYQFADINGVRRLQRVTGEPTQNCVSSEVEYEYDTSGNVLRKIQNGQITAYQYDNQNREISRTEAAGTPEARTVTTEYHPTLNKPVTIAEPGKRTLMTYDAEGRLTSTSTQSTAAQ